MDERDGWHNRRTLPQDRCARQAGVTRKARHWESGLGCHACRARRARRALEKLAEFFSILLERRRHDEVDNVGALLVLSVIWSTVATGKELSPR
jgi:hypothetical protein